MTRPPPEPRRGPKWEVDCIVPTCTERFDDKDEYLMHLLEHIALDLSFMRGRK